MTLTRTLDLLKELVSQPLVSLSTVAGASVAFLYLSSGCNLGLPDVPDPIDAGSVVDVTPGIDAGDAGLPSCMPNVAGFRPSEWHTPSGAHQNKCNEAQATELAECAANDNPGACLPFKNNSANATCYACAVTSTLAATYGPIIDDGYLTPNIEGCVALVSNDVTPAGCGARMRANSECADFGCQACQDAKGFDSCIEYASAVTCATYDTTCVKTFESQCITASSYKEILLRLIKLFCGP